ncbi:hypothetical protein ACE02U_09010 [Shewanella xiamenensis]|uniref:hypothetical protein n=1 Tax=Shewanella xiamenensis TaxID=332186 RepID=UPI0035B72615
MKEFVYRIQDKQGRGPFKPGFTLKWLQQEKNLPPYFLEFPDLNLQTETNQNDFIGCACLNLDQLRKWFTPHEYQILKKLGFKLVRLEADKILRRSENQCVFSRTKRFDKNAVVMTLYLPDTELAG